MANLKLQEVEGGVIFGVKIVPGSSRTCVSGLLDGRVKIKVAAAPERGRANEAVVGFLSKKVGVRKKCVSIISGKMSAVKEVQVSGVSAETLLKKLNLNS